MRILELVLVFIILLTSCKEIKKEPFDLNVLPNDWVRLTEKEGELVVYNSCDAGNLLLTIANKNGHFELLRHGQQEDYKFEILEVSQQVDTIFINAKWKETDEMQTFKFYWTDKHMGLGRWITTFSNGFTSDDVFVAGDKQMNFEKVDQPCKECWGDECDEVEKAGTESPIEAIRKVFDDYVKYEESADSQDDKDLLAKSLKSLTIVSNPGDLELLINVWMYYDPTDFPVRDLVYKVLKDNKSASIDAVKGRVDDMKEWESEDIAPYSELEDLMKQLVDE